MKPGRVKTLWVREVSLPHYYDAILFDMGFTLVEFEPSQQVAVQEALRKVGAERSVEEIRAAARAVWGDYYRAAATVTFPATPEYDRESQARLERGLLAQLGLEPDAATLETYAAALESQFRQPGALRAYPEVPDVLETLKAQGYPLGIVSNWSWNLRKRVAQVGLEPYFELVWASAYAGCNKPHPGIFQQALARMGPPGLAPERALYVGDSYEMDVVGARNAGLDVLLLDRDGKAGERDCPIIRDLWGVLEHLEGPGATA